jgi:hypothetical protein
VKRILRVSILACVVVSTLLWTVPAQAQLNWMNWDLAVLWFLSWLMDGGVRPPWC